MYFSQRSIGQLGCVGGGLNKEIRIRGVTYSIKYATKPATIRNLAKRNETGDALMKSSK